MNNVPLKTNQMVWIVKTYCELTIFSRVFERENKGNTFSGLQVEFPNEVWLPLKYREGL